MARRLADFEHGAEAGTRSVGGAVGKNVLPGNVWGLCGVSVPVQQFGQHAPDARLPVGLQILCLPMQEEIALGLGMAVEALSTQ